MTDREKIAAVFEAFEVPYIDRGKSIQAARRKFYFDDAGELERVIDYQTSTRSTVAGSEMLSQSRMAKYEVGEPRLVSFNNSQIMTSKERLV